MKSKTFILSEVSSRLRELQENVIGIFKHPASDVHEMLIDDSEHTFDTLHVGEFLGAQTSSYPKSKFQPILFPNGKTLSQMMEDPIEFDKWFKQLYN